MIRRLFHLLVSAACLTVLTGGVQAQASPIWAPILATRVHRPAPLVSAMFLILAGMGISMLFDKRE